MRIQPGITSKLFLAILATCIVVALAMGAAMRYSFHASFTNYLHERDQRRAEILTDTLAEVYRELGSWDPLRTEPRLWWRILRAAPGTGPGRTDDGFSPSTPFFLVDRDGRAVAGAGVRNTLTAPVHRHLDRTPIQVDGATVGWLVRQPLGLPPDALDERFATQQLQATWMTGIVSVLVAALVSLLLARMLLAPIQRIGRATHQLAAGQYHTRVTVDRHDELGQLADDFNRLATTLEKNETLRRELVADISHELRTPLAVLRGELEALQDGVRSLTPASIESLQHEVATLQQLITDLHELALADVGAMTYRLQRIDALAVLRQACQAYAERLAARPLQWQAELPDAPIWLQGDEQRLSQLFHNLLENTLRYTDPGGQVRLRARRQGNALHIDLEDSAPGVPTELLPRLFERLFRVEHSRNRDHGGSGLGLAICQRIVEAHGGQIRALPSALGGIHIQVILPLGPTLS